MSTRCVDSWVVCYNSALNSSISATDVNDHHHNTFQELASNFSNSALHTLPDCNRGTFSTNTTPPLNRLCSEIRSLTNSLISSAVFGVGSTSGRRAMKARGTSVSLTATPATATSATRGCSVRIASSSAGAILRPL